MALIYNIEFKADTRTFQSQFASVARTMQTELNKAMDLHLGGTINADLAGVIKGAQVFEQAMLKATTVNGTSFVTLNSELRKAGVSAESLVASFSGAQMRESTSKLIETFTFANRQVLTLNGSIQEMGRVLVQSFKFSTAQQFIRFAQSALNDGLRWSQDMNKALTEIEIVTGNTAEGMDRVFDSIVKGSQKLGIAAKEYAEAALIFYQQGLAEDEVGKRTEITIKAAKAAGQNVKEMSEQLTAVWNTYKMQGEQLENAASIAARLGAETAVDFKYIAEAMQTAAVAGSQLGVSYQSLAAIIATVGETTLQSASVIGNAYKTIFARLTNLKTSGEDAGESLGRITQSLSDMGVQILESNGDLKKVDDIIQDLGNTWDTYSNKQQIAIAQTVGGVRQFTQFLALMQNFDKYQTNLASAMDEQLGRTLGTQFDTWSNSMEASAARAKEAWASAFAGLFNASDVKDFYKAVEQAGKVVGQLISGFGGLKGIITMIAALFSKQIAAGMTNMLRMGADLVKNATLEGRQKQAQIATQKQINNLMNQYNSAVAAGNTQTAKDHAYTLHKLAAQKKISDNVVALQDLAANGNAQQQAEANAQIALLQHAQQRYNLTLDQMQALEDEIKVYEIIADQNGSLTQEEQSRLDAITRERDALEELARERFGQLDEVNQESDQIVASLGVTTKGIMESLTGLVTGVLLAGQGFQQLSNIISGEAEPSFANISQAIMMLVPGIMQIVGGIKGMATEIPKMVTQLIAWAAAKAGVAVADMTLAGALSIATAAIWAQVVAFLALAWPILAIIAVVGALIALFVVLAGNAEKAAQGHRDMAKAAAESAEANKETSKSLQDLVGNLRDLKNQLDAGEISFDEYRKQVAATRESLVEMMKTNPDFRIDLIMFDASSAEKQVEMVEKALTDSNQRIIDSLDAVKEHYKAAGDLSVKSKDMKSDRGVEALESAASKLSSSAQASIGDASGWNLDAIAENWDELLNEMSATQRIEFQKMMGDVEQFGDIYNTTLAASFAEGQNAFNSALSTSGGDPTKMAGFMAENSLAAQIRSDNAEAINALSERQTLLEAEKDKAQTAYDLALESGFDTTKALENLNTIKGKLSLLDIERNNIMKDVADAEEKASMSYDDMQAAIANSGDKQLQQMDAAIKAIAVKTGKSYTEIADAISKGDVALTDSVQKAMKLLDAKKGNLIGLSGEQTIRVNLALAEGAVKDFKAQLATLTDDLDATGKVEWLEATNEQIKEMNKALAEVGMAPVQELTAAFFGLSESSREAYMETLNATAAEATYASVQGQLAQVLSTKNTLILQLTGSTTASGEEALKAAQDEVDAIQKVMQAKKDHIAQVIADAQIARQTELDSAQQAQALAQQALDAQAAKGKDTSKQEEALAKASEGLLTLENDIKNTAASEQAALDALNLQYEAAIEVQTRLTDAINSEKVLEVEGEEALVETLTEAEAAVHAYNNALEGITNGTLANSEAAVDALKAAWDDLVEVTAKNAGLDSDDLSGYTEHLQRLTKSTLVNTDALKDNQKLALSVATATMRLNKGIDDLADGFKEWKDVLTKSDQASQEFYEALTGIDEAMSNILNIDMGTLSIDFFTTAENLALMEKAAKGSVDALTQLQLAAATDLLTNMEMFAGFATNGADAITGLGDAATISADKLAMLPGLMDMINNTPVGQNLGDDFVNGLNTMLEGMTMTKESFDNFCDSMGVEVDYETTSVPTEKTGTSVITSSRPTAGTPITIPDPSAPDGQKIVNMPGFETFTTPGTPYKYTEMVDMVSFAANPTGGGKPNKPVTAGRRVSAPSMSNYSPQNAGGAKTPGKGGGGSKPKEAKKVEKTKGTDVLERYADINQELDKMATKLGRVATATDKAFGMSKIALMQKQGDLLAEQGGLYQDLYNEAKRYYDTIDKNALLEKSSIAKFNEYGAVMNPEEVRLYWQNYLNDALKTLNAVEDKWNTLSGDQQEDNPLLDDAKKVYEAATELADGQIELMTKLNETSEIMQKALDDAVANMYEMVTSKISEIQYKVELRVSINERDLRMLNQILSRIGDRQSARWMDDTFKGAKLTMESLEEMKEGFGDLNTLMEDLADPAKKADFFKDFSPEALAEFNKSGKLSAEVMDAMFASADSMLDKIEELYAANDAMWDTFISALQRWREEFDSILNQMDRQIGMLDTWLNIWEKSRQKYSDPGLALEVLDNQIEANMNKITALRENGAALADELGYAQSALDLAATHYGVESVEYQKAYDEVKRLEEAINENEVAALEATDAALDAVIRASEASRQKIIDDFTMAFNAVGTTWDEIMQRFSSEKKTQEFFVHDKTMEFELGQMAREIQKAMEKATDPAHVQALQEQLAVVNGHLQDGTKFTREQLDIFKKQWELKQAQALWEEQQEQKKTMRLSRDTSGNWSYVYSADETEDKGNEDKVAELEYNLWQMNYDAMQKYSEQWLQIQNERAEFVANRNDELWNADTEQGQRYREWYQAEMDNYDTLLELHVGVIDGHLEAIDMRFGDTVLGVVTGQETISEANDAWQANVRAMTEAINDDYDKYERKVDEVLTAAGIDHTTLATTVRTKTKDIMDENSKLRDDMTKLRTTMNTEMTTMITKLASWATSWSSYYAKMIQDVYDLIKALDELARKQAGSSGSTFDYKTDYSQTMTDYEQEGEADDAGRAAIAGSRYAKQLAAYLGQIDLYQGDAEYMRRVKEEWTDKTGGVTPDMITEQQYIDYYLKNKKFWFDTGGLADGPMVAGLSMDGKKEIVLNASDTENFLQAIQIMRESITAHLGALGMKRAAVINGVPQPASEANGSATPIIIQADFPNVTAREEIEAAFANLVNQAAQYQLKPRG